MDITELKELESEVQKHKKQKKLLILLALLLFLVFGILFWALWSMGKTPSQYDLDADALAGFLPGRTQEEIETELNRIIQKGYFNVSINPTPIVSPDGQINVMIENVPANNYWMQVDVYLQESRTDERLIYSSGIIKQGFYIESGEMLGERPPAGEYNGRAIFRALMPETMEEIGTTGATMLIFVE